MAAVVLGWLFPVPHQFIGAHLYDLYAQSLLAGRFDLPAMDLRYEGHFTSDGTGYLYYGLGPVITRIPFLPLVDLPTSWISGLSIWFWAVIGNICFHRAFWLALTDGMGRAVSLASGASTLLAVAVWFAAPGLLLIGNGAIFFEPISMAYALSGGFVLLLAMAAFGKITMERAFVPLAILAGLTLHARPHLAVGYYVTVCLIALFTLRRGGLPAWKTVASGMLVLGLSGIVLLASNALRFGDAATMHGSFAKSEVQYASVFWGLEDENGPRASAFAEHGRFNAARILPNAIVYVASPPSGFGMQPVIDAVERLHTRFIAPSDFVPIHQPKAGTLFLWPGWMLLMAIGLTQRSQWRMPAVAGLVGVAVASLLMLSYPTVALRYHIDLWPAIALPAVFGLAAVSRKAGESRKLCAVGQAVMLLLLAIGILVTVQKLAHSRVMNRDLGGRWTTDFCLDLTARKGFGVARSHEICGLDNSQRPLP